MNDQVLTDPDKVQRMRLFMLQRFDEKGITISGLCKLKNMSYNVWYRRIFSQNELKLDHFNFMLQMLNYEYKLVLINNNIHKVYQSSMNF